MQKIGIRVQQFLSAAPHLVHIPLFFLLLLLPSYFISSALVWIPDRLQSFASACSGVLSMDHNIDCVFLYNIVDLEGM